MDGQIRGENIFHEDVFVRAQRLVAFFDQIIAQLAAVENAAKGANNSISFQQAQNENTTAIQRTNAALSEREKLTRTIDREIARSTTGYRQQSTELVRLRTENQRLNRVKRREQVILTSINPEYRKLSNRYREAQERLKELVVTTGRYSAAARNQGRVVEDLGRRINEADKAANDFRRNVGNYPSGIQPAIASLRQLVGAFGVIEGIRLGVRVGRDLSNLAREARGVRFAFDRLGNDGVDNFNRIRTATRGLFSDLNIQQAQIEFDNFNLSGERLASIMEFIAVRSAQTGKSFEFLRNSAIEAITKESILRADNLGLSQAALNEELDKGVDFLTAFGNVADREIARAGNILEEASNGGQRFTANLDNMRLAIGENINTVEGFGIINDIFERGNLLIELQGKFLEGNITLRQRLAAGIGALTEKGAAENRQLLDEIANRKALSAEIEAQAKAYERLFGFASGPITEFQSLGGSSPFSVVDGGGSVGQEQIVRTLTQINEEIEKYNGILEETNVNDKQAIQTTLDKIKALEDEKKAVLGISDTQRKSNTNRKETQVILEGSVKSYEKIIAELKDEKDRLAKSTEEYEEYNRQIAKAQEGIDRLTKALIVLSDAPNVDFSAFGGSGIGSDQTEDFAEGFAKRQEEQTEKAELEAKRRVQIKEALNKRSLENAKDLTSEQLDALRDAFELELDLRKDFEQAKLDLAFNTFDALTQARVDSVDKEIEENQRALDAVLDNTESSEQQKLAAEQKFEEEREKLEEKKRKREREGLILQQAVALAEIAINLSKTLAAINTAATAIDAVTPFLLGTAGAAYRATNIPLAIGTAAVESASVISQLIPAFYRGKNFNDNYEGPATWGELRREVKIGKDGNVELSPNKTTPLFVKKDDIITPSVGSFKSAMSDPSSEVFKRVVGSKYGKDNEARLQAFTSIQGRQIDEKLLEKAMTRAILKSKFNVSVDNKFPKEAGKYFKA
jgi:hypothetical protein